MMRHARWIYPALVCVMIALYYAIQPARVTMVAAVGLLSVAVIVRVSLISRPARRTAWLLVACGLSIVVAGEFSFNVLSVGGRTDGFPSVPDWLYLAAYLPLAVGLLWLGLPRSPARDISGMIETAALSLAGSLIVWITLVEPTVRSTHLNELGKLVLVAGWVGDVVVLASALRLIMVWPRKPAAWLIALALLSLFTGDVRYGDQLLRGTWNSGGQADAGILGFFGLLGAAALTRSMMTIGSTRPDTRRQPAGGLAALAFALLIAPTALLLESSASSATTPIAIVGAVIGMLVIVRLGMALSAHRRAVARDAVVLDASRNMGLAMDTGDVTASLESALAEMSGHHDTSVRLVTAPESGDGSGTRLRVPVSDAASANPLRDVVYTAPAAVLAELEDILVGLATQASIALQRIALTERVRVSEHEQQLLAYRASHDGLTGLANSEQFRRELRDASHTVEPGMMTSVLFIDLDDFKNINDTLGHEAGDAILISTARRIHECLRRVDLGARLGGDEFAVLLRDVADEAAAYGVADRLTEALSEPTTIGGIPVVCRASVGLASAGEPGQYDALLRRADTALYAAKAAGKGRWRPYQPQMQSPLRRGSDLRIELERALRFEPGEPNGLAMHYQPIIELATDRTVGFEALIRWQHPERGTIKVPELIALAEHTGLILPLGDWVLASAFRDGVRLTETGCYVSINVSVAQLRLTGFTDRIRDRLRESPIDPERVIVEITESQLVQDDERIWDDLAELRTSGIRVAIDDYGTGYASLSYLRHPVIDIVKLDRRFLENIAGDRAQALLRAVLGLTHDLKLPMIAEGIEDEPTRAALVELRCEYGQGHLFARAMPAPDALGWLTRSSG